MHKQHKHPAQTRPGTRRGKVLFIGLDAAESTLLQRYMDDGELPAIASLVRTGDVATPPPPPGLGNGATWPTAFTGMGPASNGRYYYQQFDPATYRFVDFIDDRDFAGPPFWTLASDAGKRVAVIDMVHGPLATSINGTQIVDWLTHDRMFPARSMPPDLIHTVERTFGADPWGGHADKAYGALADKDPAVWLAKTVDRIERKAEYSARLLESEDWDLFTTVFSDTHDFGHLFWHLHDPGHPGFDPQWFARHGDPMKTVLRAIDSGVAQLLDVAGPDTHVILFTGPGMGPNYSANLALEDMLLRLESSYTSLPLRRRAKSMLREVYKRSLPHSIRARINLSERARSMAPSASVRFDPRSLSGRMFFQVPNNDNAGAVRLNIAGRESRGVLSPAEADAMTRRLVADLRDIRNDETGEPLVSEVIIAKERFSGPLLDSLPDLLVVWNRPKPIRRISSSRIGSIAVPMHPVRTGDHTDRTLFIHRSAQDDQARVDTALLRVEDIAPIVLELLGVPVPGAFDGVARVKAVRGSEQPGTAADHSLILA